jgi:hypothetical protein
MAFPPQSRREVTAEPARGARQKDAQWLGFRGMVCSLAIRKDMNLSIL